MSAACDTLRLDRRRFIEGLAAAAMLPAGGILGCGASAGNSEPRTLWLSAQGDEEATFGLAASPDPHVDALQIPTGFRGHDVAQHPTRPWEVVLFGRRPGTSSAAIDVSGRRVETTFSSTTGRAFQGHGFFTPDGLYLITSEADTVSGAGWLGIRETDTYSLVGEVETFGIGPHQVLLLADGRTAVVANGGLLTRPETGSEVLNLDTMDSTLAYVDLESGGLVSEHRAAVPKGSIRHMDVTDEGAVVIGIQVQRDALSHDDVVPLAGIHRQGDEIVLFDDGLDGVALMNDYIGSVAVCSDARVGGFTSPRGDVTLFWDLDTGAQLGMHRLVDCSGIAESPDRGHFIISSSLGEVRTLRASDLDEVRSARKRFNDVRWDNHLIAVVVED